MCMIIHLFRIDLRECSVTYSQEYVKEGNVEEGRVICPSELVSYLRSITLWIYLQYPPTHYVQYYYIYGIGIF